VAHRRFPFSQHTTAVATTHARAAAPTASGPMLIAAESCPSSDTTRRICPGSWPSQGGSVPAVTTGAVAWSRRPLLGPTGCEHCSPKASTVPVHEQRLTRVSPDATRSHHRYQPDRTRADQIGRQSKHLVVSHELEQLERDLATAIRGALITHRSSRRRASSEQSRAGSTTSRGRRRCNARRTSWPTPGT